MRVSIIGAGYVGLVSGACLAEKGHEVVCEDVDPGKIETIRGKVPPFHEAGLPELLQKHVGHGFTADTDLRLCRFFGLSDGWWLRLQADHDTEVTKTTLAKVLAKIKPWVVEAPEDEASAQH